MKRTAVMIVIFSMIFCMAACSSPQSPAQQSAAPSQGNIFTSPQQGNILVAYVSSQENSPISRAASLLGETLNAQVLPISENPQKDYGMYEFILLGFDAENNILPEEITEFLTQKDFGAKTIFPFAAGSGNNADGILNAVSQLQPGALLGGALIILEETQDQAIVSWAQSLNLLKEDSMPEESGGNTVLSAAVTPHSQQTLYLWEENNAPAVTQYTQNNGAYSDDPDFRPYITSFPVPQGVEIKGAVLICPGGAFQFRSDQPEGIEVAQALSALGYQSFVVDYRLRPYTQQEGALDLARAVRFVRAHAEEYGIEEKDIAVMGFSAGGILSGEMLLNFDGEVNGTALDSDYIPDQLDMLSADAAACGMIYSFYGRLSVGTTDVELLRRGNLPPTFYCYGTRDPFYRQFLANADAAEEAGVNVERLQLDNMPHGFGSRGGWIPAFDSWLSNIFTGN